MTVHRVPGVLARCAIWRGSVYVLCVGERRLHESSAGRLNDDDWRQQPLEKCKARLEALLDGSTGVRFSEHLDGTDDYFRARMQDGP